MLEAYALFAMSPVLLEVGGGFVLLPLLGLAAAIVFIVMGRLYRQPLLLVGLLVGIALMIAGISWLTDKNAENNWQGLVLLALGVFGFYICTYCFWKQRQVADTQKPETPRE